MNVAQWIVNLAMVYALIGSIFAIAFALFGVERIDPSAKGSPLFFRLLIIPGAAALWPLLLKRWLSGTSHPPIETNPHREISSEETS